MSSVTQAHERDQGLGALCAGVLPLTARWEPWQDHLCSRPSELKALLREHGSPLHLHCPDPFRRNARALGLSAEKAGVRLKIFFARKADKCLAYVDAARDDGFGVDVASEVELRQALDAGVPAERLIATPAVKTVPFVDLCVERGVVVALDNSDDVEKVAAAVRRVGVPAKVAVRVSGFDLPSERYPSRFGYPADEVLGVVAGWRERKETAEALEVEGLHFHLDGYRGSHRVVALDRCLALRDDLGHLGVRLHFIDMGGGFPVSYLSDGDEWWSFWRELEEALLGFRKPITYRNASYGLHANRGEILGDPCAYPHFQEAVGARWLEEILESPRPSDPATTLAQAFRRRDLPLHCEPGRYLLDGCGMTVAEVEHRKPSGDGDWLIGLDMNASHCRSRKSELFADPRLLPAAPRPVGGTPRSAMEGYLTGACCAEGDLISHRKLRFSGGVEVGDLVVFPNTAGYYMHFVENRSHLFPLPKNLVVEPAADPGGGGFELDRIDGTDPSS